MFRSNAKSFSELRTYLDHIPVIETHEHYTGIDQPIDDVLAFITNNYLRSDLISAAFQMDEQQKQMLGECEDISSFEQRTESFMQIYEKTDKTAYAKGVDIGLRECWGINDISSPGALKELEKKLKDRDQTFFKNMMLKYNIKAMIVDIYQVPSFMRYVEGKEPYTEYCRFAFPLPSFHCIHSSQDIVRLSRYLDHAITSLDDYVESFENFFKKCLDFGIVCVKDQSAYRRNIKYANPCKAEAESVFNDMISNPRDVFGDDRARALDDWLFHRFLRIAAKHDLPVQLHTGHMAGIYNDISKANAVNLTSVLELHKDVRFDLFHGNWPYMDEYLFLGKNYPNVWLDLCWTQTIDPLYSIELMKRAVMTVPHSKVFAFGGDTSNIEWAVGYLVMARDNVACALSELIDSGWLKMDEAKQIAADWLFNNPNRIFKLGFKDFLINDPM